LVTEFLAKSLPRLPLTEILGNCGGASISPHLAALAV
jgi:hypothetical protein